MRCNIAFDHRTGKSVEDKMPNSWDPCHIHHCNRDDGHTSDHSFFSEKEWIVNNQHAEIRVKATHDAKEKFPDVFGAQQSTYEFLKKHKQDSMSGDYDLDRYNQRKLKPQIIHTISERTTPMKVFKAAYHLIAIAAVASIAGPYVVSAAQTVGLPEATKNMNVNEMIDVSKPVVSLLGVFVLLSYGLFSVKRGVTGLHNFDNDIPTRQVSYDSLGTKTTKLERMKKPTKYSALILTGIIEVILGTIGAGIFLF